MNKKLAKLKYFRQWKNYIPARGILKKDRRSVETLHYELISGEKYTTNRGGFLGEK